MWKLATVSGVSFSQISQNSSLHSAFAMARRYVYLAAKAYDYETGLLRHDGAVGAPGREFL